MKHDSIQATPNLFQLGTSSFTAYLSMGEIGMIIEGGTGPTTDIIVSQVESLEYYCSSIKKMASVPAERVLLSHNGMVNMDAKTYMRKALRVTEGYHQELVKRLADGEDRKAISS